MRTIKYCITKEPPCYVATCLNVEVSSFGETVEEAILNLQEAVELYFEDNESVEFRSVDEVMIGERIVNA
jgi:predicted RNase H-like HicB family nuclease